MNSIILPTVLGELLLLILIPIQYYTTGLMNKSLTAG